MSIYLTSQYAALARLDRALDKCREPLPGITASTAMSAENLLDATLRQMQREHAAGRVGNTMIDESKHEEAVS